MTVRDAVLRALNSGWPVTLTAEEAQEVYDALKAIRTAREATPRCYVTGNPCGTDTVMAGFDCPGTGGRCRNKPHHQCTEPK